MHTCLLRPLYGECDGMGVVYYANYLRFFERGRAELMRAGGRTYAQLEREGLHLPVTEAHLRYRKPARYDELLALETSLEWVKKASMRFTYRLMLAPDGQPTQELISGYTTHGCVDLEGRVRPMPTWLIDLLRPHLAK